MSSKWNSESTIYIGLSNGLNGMGFWMRCMAMVVTVPLPRVTRTLHEVKDRSIRRLLNGTYQELCVIFPATDLRQNSKQVEDSGRTVHGRR